MQGRILYGQKICDKGLFKLLSTTPSLNIWNKVRFEISLKPIMKSLLHPSIWIACAFAAISLATLPALGAPKSRSDAANAVQGWLKLDPQPFGHSLSSKIKRT